MPTIAVIHGPCLGGGLELALACDHRVARDNSSTKIGLPEIKLGFIPGWGGTQRLPRLVGLSSALPMILTGKHLGASEALEIGLIDRAIAPGDWEAELASCIEDVLQGKQRNWPKAHRPIWRRIMDGTSRGTFGQLADGPARDQFQNQTLPGTRRCAQGDWSCLWQRSRRILV